MPDFEQLFESLRAEYSRLQRAQHRWQMVWDLSGDGQGCGAAVQRVMRLAL